LIDTHDDHVIDPVWELYRLAHTRTGGISTLLEWDAKIPEFPVLHAEVLKARQYMNDLDQSAPRRPVAQADKPPSDHSPGVSNPIAYIVADIT
jgi:uncharacterized protein (UPF0276 family)